MRVLVAWCPDWPVVAALADRDEVPVGPPRPDGVPAAVLRGNLIVACNEAARQDGVRRGHRRRDAQARCPELVLLAAQPDRDARLFEPVLAAVEALRPEVAALRPGLLAVRSPSRYYGSDENAAALIAETVVALGVHDVRIGVADDLFTAEQAARSADRQSWVVVPECGSVDFLAPLPVTVLADQQLAGLLRRLGLTTLGAFASLEADEVSNRLGAEGLAAHRQVRGADPLRVGGRRPPEDFTVEARFEPPLSSVESACFSMRRPAEEFVATMAEQGLVATSVRIEVEADDPQRTVLSARSWVHAGCFSSADLIDRVHWQLRATPDGVLLGAPVGLIRVEPETVEPAAQHAVGLWGGNVEAVSRGVAKVQAMIGYDAVKVPLRQGGRAPAERQYLATWGESPGALRAVHEPWPGAIPGPAPSRVFVEPWAASVTTTEGRPVLLTDRGVLTGPPGRIHTGARHGWHTVAGWAGPWPVASRPWEETATLSARLQIVDEVGRAWLVRCDTDRWWVEAAYE